jgi:UrcA family protein
MTTLVTRSISASVFAFGLAIAASHALADPQPKRSLEPAVTVRFADLNTSTAEGSRVLYARVSAAALAVCAGGFDWYPRGHWVQKVCYRDTVEHVVAMLNFPALTAVHLARTHRGPAAFGLQAGNR